MTLARAGRRSRARGALGEALSRRTRQAQSRVGSTATVRTWTTQVDRRGLGPLLWTFPVVFALHEAEEVVGTRWFTPAARTRAAYRLRALGASEGLIDRVAGLTAPQMAIAVTVVASGVGLVTVRAAGSSRDLRGWQAAFSVFAAHSITHLAQAGVLRAYTPGVVTAATLIPWYSAYAIRRLRAGGAWDAGTVARALPVGVAAAALVLSLGHGAGALGRGRRADGAAIAGSATRNPVNRWRSHGQPSCAGDEGP